jgi:hypothetical protein
LSAEKYREKKENEVTGKIHFREDARGKNSGNLLFPGYLRSAGAKVTLKRRRLPE